jgi:hypothetical protein
LRRRHLLVLAGFGLAGCSRPAEGPASVTEAAPAARSPAVAASLFTPGSRLRLTTGDEAVTEVLPAGRVRLSSGRLMAADPSWLPAGSWSPAMGPFTATVPPGAYAVDLALLRWNDLRVAAARLTIADKPVARWEPALLAGQEPSTLKTGEFFGTGVDTGMIALFDADAADAVGRAELPVIRADQPHQLSGVVVFSSGWGDGYYPTWVGRSADGMVTCFIVDMLMVAV